MALKAAARGAVSPASRILIIRPSAIGDVVMASPMLEVLRAACPDGHICWLVEPHIVDLLKTNRCLDRTIVWPKAAWRRLWQDRRWFELAREIQRFARGLRQERFDLVLDVQGLLRSRLLAWLTRAPVRVGFASKEPGRFLLTRLVSRGDDDKRMGSEYQHMMRELGLDPGPFHQCLDIDGDDASAAAAALEAAGIAARFVAFAPFTTRPQKHWFEQRWSELARCLADRFSVPVVLLGGAGDHAAAQRICAAAGGGVTSLAGKLSLAQTMAVVRLSTLLVGVDTGLTHMGPAFARPTVALFGATCPYLETSRDNTVVLYHRQPCSPCRRSPTCDGKYPCMGAIPVSEVLEHAGRLFPSAGPPP